MNRKRRSFSSRPLLIIPILAIAAAVIVIVIANRRTEDTAAAATVERLEAMEAADIAHILNMPVDVPDETAETAAGSEEIPSEADVAPAAVADPAAADPIPSETEAPVPEPQATPEAPAGPLSRTPEEIAAIQFNILNGDFLSNPEIRQVFQNTVILGDSITESTWEYGFLDQDVVISKRGISVVSADDLIQAAINSYPSVIFMSFGSNDLEIYQADVNGFIESYREQVHKLKQALPSVPIYINCILPLTEGAIEETPALIYYPFYNAALQEMCVQEGLAYLDETFLVTAIPSLYEPDGQHVVVAYYPLWLTYMARMAGLI